MKEIATAGMDFKIDDEGLLRYRLEGAEKPDEQDWIGGAGGPRFAEFLSADGPSLMIRADQGLYEMTWTPRRFVETCTLTWVRRAGDH